MEFDCCLVKYKSGESSYSYCYLLEVDGKDDYKQGLKDSGKADVSVIYKNTEKEAKEYNIEED